MLKNSVALTSLTKLPFGKAGNYQWKNAIKWDKEVAHCTLFGTWEADVN